MIIRIEETQGERLDDAMDFRRFKIVSDLGRQDYERAKAVAGSLIEFESPDQAWVSAAALEELVDASQRGSWKLEFDRMIEKARPHGWIRDDPLRIAAHVEWKGSN